MPSRAHTAAVATPCWPAPVSAMIRGLAHPPGQQRLADRVVDLVRAGVRQAFQLDVDAGAAELARGILRVQERGGPAGEVPQSVRELPCELRDPRRPPGMPPRSSSSGRAEHLRDVPAAVAAEEIVIRSHACRSPRSSFSSFVRSLRPGDSSSPLDASISSGDSSRMTSPDVVRTEAAGQPQRPPAAPAPGERARKLRGTRWPVPPAACGDQASASTRGQR